jgi:hypothetical protein
VLLEVALDDAYSQHVVLARAEPGRYPIMLGSLKAGTHRLTVRRDDGRSAYDSGTGVIRGIDIEVFDSQSSEHAWLSQAPFLRARPGALERFSDVPLLTYVERDVTQGEGGQSYQYQYTTIFSHEDGGTPADRLMATWGRTTDIEFVYGITIDGHRLIQTEGHQWMDFGGATFEGHPELWVVTYNNMVADRGPADVVRFGPAPRLVALRDQSREAVMDANAWTYQIAAAEALREGRVDPSPPAGSGRIVDPRRYATVEACADVVDALLAIDVGTRTETGVEWYPTDQDERFRVARGGCFRSSAPLPVDATPRDVVGVRVRAYAREGRLDTGLVVLRRVNKIFMLDSALAPDSAPGLEWQGELQVPVNGTPVEVAIAR